MRSFLLFVDVSLQLGSIILPYLLLKSCVCLALRCLLFIPHHASQTPCLHSHLTYIVQLVLLSHRITAAGIGSAYSASAAGAIPKAETGGLRPWAGARGHPHTTAACANSSNRNMSKGRKKRCKGSKSSSRTRLLSDMATRGFPSRGARNAALRMYRLNGHTRGYGC